jgi:hypothetical protein
LKKLTEVGNGKATNVMTSFRGKHGLAAIIVTRAMRLLDPNFIDAACSSQESCSY